MEESEQRELPYAADMIRAMLEVYDAVIFHADQTHTVRTLTAEQFNLIDIEFLSPQDFGNLGDDYWLCQRDNGIDNDLIESIYCGGGMTGDYLIVKKTMYDLMETRVKFHHAKRQRLLKKGRSNRG